MDRLGKFLAKLTKKERDIVLSLLLNIKKQSVHGLDIKKLKGREDIYRVRKGSLRIIYRVAPDGAVLIIDVGRRNDNTYN